jgi:hypothetical protein
MSRMEKSRERAAELGRLAGIKAARDQQGIKGAKPPALTAQTEGAMIQDASSDFPSISDAQVEELYEAWDDAAYDAFKREAERLEEARCKCGEWSGSYCDATAEVTVDWVPQHLRDDGRQYDDARWESLRVSRECAKSMVEEDGDWVELVED